MSPWWAVAALGLPFIALLLLVWTFLFADAIPGPVYALSMSCAIVGGVAAFWGAMLIARQLAVSALRGPAELPRLHG